MRSNRHTTQAATLIAYGISVRAGRAQLFRALAAWTLVIAATLAASSCQYDRLPQDATVYDSIAVGINIQTNSVSGIDSDYEGYEVGSEWENYIDTAGGDYHIYFFTYDPNDPYNAMSNNVLIAEFVPTETSTSQTSAYTTYTLTGNVGEDIAKHTNFKVVVLANWGQYPTVTPNVTTIDGLVEGEYTTFQADTFLNGVDREHRIPFYGVSEYSGVTWKSGWRLTLPDDITLLRAVAKVEVVMSETSEIDSFESVSVVGYNSAGYCAPKGVYLRADYDHGYTWEQDFTEDIHLVGGANDSSAASNTYSFTRIDGADTDTWTIYLPEYDNLSDTTDCSLIQVKVNGEEHPIHFSNYSDGTTSSPADYDIHRNCLYRFVVTVANHNFVVFVNKWDELFDSEFDFNDETEEPD